MSKILDDIKDHQLQARKSRDTKRARILTYFIGEVERSIAPSDVTDEKVASKLRNVCGSLMDEEEIAILEFYLPKSYDANWHLEFVKQGIHAGAFKTIPEMMKLVTAKQKNGEFEKTVDKSLLNRFLTELVDK